MNVMFERTPAELRAAFLELSMGEGQPDPETLDALVQRLPQYAQELTDFAIDLAIVGIADEDETFIVSNDQALDAEAASALSVFQNALFNARKDAASAPVEEASVDIGALENPFAGLGRREMKAVMADLKANAAFIMKLRDRAIFAETLTEGFMRRVGEILSKPLEQMVMHFQAAQTIAPLGQSFKADNKPVAGAKQTFEEALQNSGLNEEQQAYLRSL
ncbi:hypothetical protein [Rhizobium leguminosarum]|uniref:hypothetical protein n=1 Tax=Rhizobium leguminosarum TaxID=384 RepID=UPI0010301E59|nr:hypothetical protein [Rhizobium leguminosarum]TBG96063.1 hypothetical protein ELG68_36005 [Rhizobium leguminosarum]